ncbi:MAG: B12-binding domain-containing radical SAM protein [Candidatus Methanoperedenaceae archaeon]|nr:B12-binding domain-containing radical SAM protein [Candidatus Methanoperedenaceae archaeon]
MQKIHNYPINLKSRLQIEPVVSEWPALDLHASKVLLVSINMPGYYSLPVRLLSTLIYEDPVLSAAFDVRFVEFENTTPVSDIVDRILAWAPEILGFSMNIWNRDISIAVATELKKQLPSITICVGGQEVTNSSIDFLEMVMAFDYVFDGEGEIAFKQFLNVWNRTTGKLQEPDSVSGLRYRKDGRVVFTGPAETISNLDALPSPILANLVPVNNQDKLGVMLEEARGCPNRCAFCFEGFKRTPVRTNSIERLADEFRYMLEKGSRYFHILSPILCNSKQKRLLNLSQLLRNLIQEYPDLCISVEAYAEQITELSIACLRFCSIIDIGLQNTNPRVLKLIHRKFNRERFLRGISLLKKYKTNFNLYLISGFPGDTMASFLEDIRFIIDQSPGKIFVNELCLLNGTELRHRAKELYIEYDSKPPYLVRSTPSFSSQDLKRVQALSKAVEHYYNLSFQGVTPQAPWHSNVENPTLCGHFRTIPLEAGCDLACEGCCVPMNMDEDLDNSNGKLIDCQGEDVLFQGGHQAFGKTLFRRAGDAQLGGARRIGLATPAHALKDTGYVNRLILSGIWHYRTFLCGPDAATHERITGRAGGFEGALAGLKALSQSYSLRGRATINPFVDLVIATAALTPETLSDTVKLGLEHKVTMITLTKDAKLMESVFLSTMQDLFDLCAKHRIWLRVPKDILVRILMNRPNAESIIKSISALGLTADESQLPCNTGGVL